MRKVKVDLIDPFKEEVTRTEVEQHNVTQIQKLIGCDCFCLGVRLDDHVVYVDDEGLFPGHAEQGDFKLGFMISLDGQKWSQLLFGRGLVEKGLPDGSSDDADIDYIVKFFRINRGLIR